MHKRERVSHLFTTKPRGGMEKYESIEQNILGNTRVF